MDPDDRGKSFTLHPCLVEVHGLDTNSEVLKWFAVAQWVCIWLCGGGHALDLDIHLINDC